MLRKKIAGNELEDSVRLVLCHSKNSSREIPVDEYRFPACYGVGPVHIGTASNISLSPWMNGACLMTGWTASR